MVSGTGLLTDTQGGIVTGGSSSRRQSLALLAMLLDEMYVMLHSVVGHGTTSSFRCT